MSKSIIHIDMDAFYASVEQRDRPELRGLPVLVGGSRDRGVVCACSYESRPFGVRSGMAMAQALRLCPKAVVLPVRMECYREASKEVFSVFFRYTDRVEGLSIDEAFLDVSDCRRLWGEARVIADRIKADIYELTGLRASAGIAPNKFLAKLASDLGKPDGLFEILPEQIDQVLLPLPVSQLWGVGRVTAERLKKWGWSTVRQLRHVPRDDLERLLGQAGAKLYLLARGIDERQVKGGKEVKSVGHEDTYGSDLVDLKVIRRELLGLAERVAARLRDKQLAGRCICLKVKYADFTVVSRSLTLDGGVNHALDIYRRALELLEKTEAGRRPLRLLGISLSMLSGESGAQQELFGQDLLEKKRALDEAMDQVRARFGPSKLTRATLLKNPGEASQGDEPADSGP